MAGLFKLLAIPMLFGILIIAYIGAAYYRFAFGPMGSVTLPQGASHVFDGRLQPVPELVVRDRMEQQTMMPGSVAGLEMMQAATAPMRDGHLKSPSGHWLLSMYYMSFENGARYAYVTPAERAYFDKIFAEWEATKSKSVTPYIIKALVLSRIAKNAREDYLKTGLDFLPPVEERKAAFDKAVAELNAYLDKIKPVADSDPQWFIAKFTALALQCGPFEPVYKVLEEGTEKFHDYQELYAQVLQRGLKCKQEPKALVERVLELAGKRADATGDEGIYARTVWNVVSAFNFAGEPDPRWWPKLVSADLSLFMTQISGPGLGVLSSDWIDWPRAKRGMDAIVKKYPDPWNVNHYALFSCAAGDGEKAHELLPLALEAPVLNAWKLPEAFAACQAWSRKWAFNDGGTPVKLARAE